MSIKEKNQLSIRPFQIDDETSVIELWQQCGLVVPWNNPAKDIKRKLKVGADLFLVGKIDNEIVASVMGGYEGHRGWINYLAVAPGFRHQGYGQAIMAEVESRIRALGAAKINLQVRSANTDIIEFYQSIGYSIDQSVSLGKRLDPDN